MANPVAVVINIAIQVVISLAIAALTPKQHLEGPRLEDTKLTTSTYGAVLPIGYGTALYAGNVIWGRDIREEATTTDIGKGSVFSPGTQTTYAYFATLAIGICEREMEAIVRIYADGKLIYRADEGPVQRETSPSTGGLFETIIASTPKQSKGFSFTFYRGTDDQEPDPIIASDYAEGEAPAYRGLCYIVIDDMELKNFGNRIPQFQFIVAASVTGSTYRQQTVEFEGPFLSVQGQIVYDRERNTMYMGRFTNDLAAGFSPHYLMTIDGETNETLGEVTHDALNGTLPLRPIAAPTGALSLTVQPNINEYFPDADAGFILGARGPYLMLVEAGSAYAIHMLVEKDTMAVIGRSYASDLTGENSILIPDPDGGTRAYYCSSGSAQIVHILGGLVAPDTFIYVGFSGGGLNLKIATGIGEPGVGSNRGRSNILVLSLPEFYPPMGNTQLSDSYYGCHGSCIGHQQAGLTTIWSLHRISNTVPSDFVILRSFVSIGGITGHYEQVLDIPHGGTVLPTDNPMRYDPATDTLVIDVRDVGIIGYAANTIGDATATQLNEKWRVLGYSMAATNVDSYTNTSPDGTILVGKDGESASAANFHILDMGTGEIELIDLVQNGWTNQDGGSESYLSISAIWDGEKKRFFSANRIVQVGWTYLTPLLERGTESLQTVVEDIALRSKLIASEIDATALSTKQVKGYPVQQSMSFRAALEPLATVFNFYAVEKDGVLVFDFNDGTVDKVIPEDDLINQGDNTSVFIEARAQDQDLPRALYFAYSSAEADWLDERNVQVARRTTVPFEAMTGTGELRVEVALTLSDFEAQEATQRILYDAWVGQDSFKFQLPQRYIDILPNDVLKIAAENRVDNVKVLKFSMSATLEVEVEGRVIDGDVYTLNVQPVSQIGSVGFGRRSVVVDTQQNRAYGVVLDVPYLQDGALNDSNGLFLFMAGNPVGFSGTFKGATLAVSANGGPYEFKATMQAGMAWGRLRGTMPDIPHVDWNGVQEITIDIDILSKPTAFSSVTQDDMIGNNANTAILYEPSTGKVEVIGFRDVAVGSLDGAATTQLTGFMRGKRGTDTMASGYTSTTYILMVDASWVTGYFEATTLLGASVRYRTIATGDTVDKFSDTAFTYEHRSLKPYAPSHPVIIEDNPSAGNWAIQWTRRTRYSGSWLDYIEDVPLNEQTEEYEVEILSGVGGTVVRTITDIPVNGFTYTEDMAIADYGSGFPNTLYLKIYQISATVGRGFANEHALTLEG